MAASQDRSHGAMRKPHPALLAVPAVTVVLAVGTVATIPLLGGGLVRRA